MFPSEILKRLNTILRKDAVDYQAINEIDTLNREWNRWRDLARCGCDAGNIEELESVFADRFEQALSKIRGASL